MTIRKSAAAWSGSPRRWLGLAAALLVLVGAAWLSVSQSDSVQADRSEFKYRPIAGSTDAASPRSVSDSARHPLDEALEFVRPSLAALKTVKDYTAVFTKTELVHGRLLKQTMDMKFRQDPFSVYFHGHTKCKTGCKAGREVIFVAGRNDDRLIVHEGGLKALVGTMNLTLDDPKVMATNRHSITDVGIAKIIESAIGIWNNEKKNLDPTNIKVRRVLSVLVGEVECEAVEIAHRVEQPGLIYQVGRVYVDKQTRLPVQGELYGWPAAPGEDPPLLEQYTYTHLKTNVGLSDADFDPQNRDYRFDVSSRD